MQASLPLLWAAAAVQLHHKACGLWECCPDRGWWGCTVRSKQALDSVPAWRGEKAGGLARALDVFDAW